MALPTSNQPNMVDRIMLGITHIVAVGVLVGASTGCGQSVQPADSATGGDSNEGPTDGGQGGQTNTECKNGRRDDGETDVDCGGPSCSACEVGRTCGLFSDCNHGTCESGTCLAGVWKTLPDMRTPRMGVSAAVLGGDIYVLGGYRDNTGAGSPRTVQVFTPTSNDWRPGPLMRKPRYGFSAVVGNDGRLYAIGAQYAGYLSNTVEAYSPDDETWSEVSAMNAHRFWGAAIAMDGYIYAFGGWDLTFLQYGSIERFSVADGTWEPLGATMITPRDSFGAGRSTDGRLFAFGGSGEGDILASTESYDVALDTWVQESDMSIARSAIASATDAEGRMYAIGGEDASKNVLSLTERFDPKSGQWSTMASMPTPRMQASAVAGPDGRIYVFGGTLSDGTETAVAEVLEP